MTDFKPGEIVDITIDGARVLHVGTEGHDDDVTPIVQVDVGEPGGPQYFVTLPLNTPTINVARVAPENWPPQPGDLWRGTNENEEDDPLMPEPGIWFCRLNLDFEADRSKLQLVPANGDIGYVETSPDKVLKSYDGRMTLVRREGATS